MEVRHDLFREHFHVVDLAVEIAGFGAEPEPGGSQSREFAQKGRELYAKPPA